MMLSFPRTERAVYAKYRYPSNRDARRLAILSTARALYSTLIQKYPRLGERSLACRSTKDPASAASVRDRMMRLKP